MHRSLFFCLITAALLAQPRPGPSPKPAFAEPGICARRQRDRVRLRRRHLDGPGGGRRGPPADLATPRTTRGPTYSPDGKQLAFVSTRTGGGDIYVLTFATGDVRRVTFDDGADQLDGWSRDGKWIYFFSTAHDLSGGMNDVYRVAAGGGTPMAVSGDRYANEFFSAASPDGRTLAMSARGTASGQWWRHGHSHLDEAEIWLRDLSAADAPAAYRAITTGGAKDLWPMWAGGWRRFRCPSAAAPKTSGQASRPRYRDPHRSRPQIHTDPHRSRPQIHTDSHRSRSSRTAASYGRRFRRTRRRDRVRAELRDLEARHGPAARRRKCRSSGWAHRRDRRPNTCG